MAESPEQRFQTHSHYIEALGLAAGRNWASPPFSSELGVLAARAQPLVTGLDKQPHGAIDRTTVRNSLKNAWGTELLLALSGRFSPEDEIVRLANTWGTVQAYYVGYHATQALRVATGHDRPASHPATQRLFADHWAKRSLDLAPWTLGLDEAGWRNVPSGHTISAVHPWSTVASQTCCDHVAKAIETTRSRKVSESEQKRRVAKQSARRKAFHAENDVRVALGKKPLKERAKWPLPHLDASEKASANKSPGLITMLDYQYRLRINSNYQESDVFTDGPTDPHVSRRVHDDLSYLSAATMLVHEMRVSQLVGQATFRQWADEWIKANVVPGLVVGIAARRHLL